MSCSSCFVPGCKTGYNSDRKKCKIEGKKVKSLFTPPGNADIFEKWKRAIPRADKELSMNNRVCELHFPADDIERYYITKLSDGTVDMMEKGRPTLKADAVPCIFPNLPAYFTKKTQQKRLPLERKAIKMGKLEPVIIKVEGSFQSNVELLSNDESSLLSNGESSLLSNGESSLLSNGEASTDFNFKYLSDNLNGIKKPSQWWCFSSTVEYIVCTRWNSEYVAEKRVIIKPDLDVKVFLKDSEYNMPDNKGIICLDDVSVLLEKIEKLILCAGIPQATKKSRNCLLRLSKNDILSVSSICRKCRNAEILLDQAAKNLKFRQYKHQQHILCEKRKNVRLQRKVNILREKVVALMKKVRSEELVRSHVAVPKLCSVKDNFNITV